MIDSLKELLVKTLTAQAYAALVAVTGFGWVFALPVLRQLSQFIISRVIAWSLQETAVGLSLLWIIVEMSFEIDNAENAKVKLKDMIENPTKYTEQQQQEILESFDETTVDLIQLSIKRLA